MTSSQPVQTRHSSGGSYQQSQQQQQQYQYYPPGSVPQYNSHPAVEAEGLVERLEEISKQEQVEEVVEKLAEETLNDNESGTGAGQTSIDNRIEQAMDLVKSHLMNAVRSEVEELKDKINKLEDTISHLSKENEILRSRASPDTIQVLTDRGLSLPGSGVQPPDPAKPPLQQH